MAATLTEVAREANVSIATVSRVINGYPHVHDVTRDTVLSAARKVGYPLEPKRRDQTANRTIMVLGGTPEGFSVSVQGNHLTSWEEYARLVTGGAESALSGAGLVVRLQNGWHYPGNPEQEAASFADDPGLAGFVE